MSQPKYSFLGVTVCGLGPLGLLPSPGPTRHPTQTLGARLCGLSQLLPAPRLSCGCVTAGSPCALRTWPCLWLADPEGKQAVQPLLPLAFHVAVFSRRAGLGAGETCLHPGMTRLHAAVPPALLPKQQRRGPGLFLSGPPGPWTTGEHPLPLPSGQCLDCAWQGELVESLGIEVNPAAGLGVGDRRGAQPAVSHLLEILSQKKTKQNKTKHNKNKRQLVQPIA